MKPYIHKIYRGNWAENDLQVEMEEDINIHFSTGYHVHTIQYINYKTRHNEWHVLFKLKS